MDMSFTPEEMAFRDEVRAFIDENYPKDLKSKRTRGEMSKEDILTWHRILYKKGWVVPHWPVEYGGTGWSITQRFIWNEENARAETQALLPFGLSMVGPVIFNYGNEEQKKRFLPGILSADDWWCQAIPSRAPVPIWPRSAPKPCATATIMSSTAARHGRRSRNMPIGCSASCAPRPTPRRRKASPSC